jgi:hypothetical protein
MYSITKNMEVNYSYLVPFVPFIVGFGICYYFNSIIMYMNRKSVKNTGKTCVIITDPDEDFDDEIALYFLIEKTKNKLQGFSNIFIAFAPGIHSSGMTGMDRKKVFQKYFPEYDNDIFKINSTTFHLLPAEKLKKMKGYNFDVFLQIAPLSNIGEQFFQNNKFGKRIIMGDISNPDNSLNLSKSFNSEELLQEFKDQESSLINVPTISITTGLSRKVPFTSSIVNSLPSEFSIRVKNKAFDLLVGRVPPTSPYCENVTVNANWITAKNYLGEDSEDKLKDFKESCNFVIIERQCEEFMNNMTSLKDRYKMKEALVDIYMVVILITNNYYKDSDFQISSLDDIDSSRDNFIEYIDDMNSSLTPAYDLLAMHLMLNPEFNDKCYDDEYENTMKKELVDHYS